MATSGIIAAYWSSTYPTARWEFAWSASPTGVAGQTKVTWTLYTRGRSESPTWLRTECTFKLWYNNGTSTGYHYIKEFKNLQDAENSFNEKFRDQGEFIVYHEADGTGNFWVGMYGYIWEYETTKSKEEYAYLDNSISGLVYVYTNNQWKKALPYVYTGGQWKQTIPYVYTGGTWKIAGG